MSVTDDARRRRRRIQIDKSAFFYCTTTGASQTLTIVSLGVSAATTVDWGDGSSDSYTGTAQRTHVYAVAGDYKVRILQPENVTNLQLADAKITLNSRDIRRLVNITIFRANLVGGNFDSVDVSHWRPTRFYLYSWKSGSTGTFDSADISAWRPNWFFMYLMPTEFVGTFDSVDIADWRPEIFNLFIMGFAFAGTFNSVDIAAWRPNTFRLNTMSTTNFTGTFNSVDVVNWKPAGTYAGVSVFRILNLGGFDGTFDSADVADWRITDFWISGMPAGYAGAFDSANLAAWRPRQFYLHSMPVATFAITISANSFKNWSTVLDTFQMEGNSFSTPQVDLILWELYQAAITPRTATAGTISVGGNNDAPSGTYQASTDDPVVSTTDGAEVAYELKEDSLLVGFNKWATVTIA